MKIKHVRTVYTKELKSGGYSNAKENIEVTEKYVSLDFFKISQVMKILGLLIIGYQEHTKVSALYLLH